MKILIVEDEKRLADSLKLLLEGKGFEAEAVYDGDTGADYALLGVYDLLILDVMMPGLDGYQLARQVRASRCTTPILMLTARSAVEDRIHGLNSGADSVLVKRSKAFVKYHGRSILFSEKRLYKCKTKGDIRDLSRSRNQGAGNRRDGCGCYQDRRGLCA